jgi:histidinol-phosphate aminotransferase
VLTVLDQAYFEYVDDPEYADGIEEYLKAGRRVVVLRTFSKIFGLAGLRVGYGVGPAAVVTAIGKVRRAFDITSPAQIAAIASLRAPGAAAELERRRRLNAEGRPAIVRALRGHGFDPVGPAVANFVFAEVGEDSRPLFEQLLREGVIVRPTAGFGAPGAIRVSVGTPEENAFFADALGRVTSAAPA